MPRKKLDHDRIIQLASEGKSRREVADIMQANYSTVSRWFWQLDLDRHHQWHPNRELIEAMVLEGKTRAQIATELDMPYSDVERYCVRHKYSPKDAYPHSIPIEDQDHIAKLASEGYSAERLASLYGVGDSAMWKYMVRHGIERHYPQVPRLLLSEADIPKIKELLGQGLYQNRAAQELGVSQMTLSRFIARHSL